MPTMTCNHTRDLFSDALEGTLAPSAERGFDRHLTGCPRCQGEFAEFRTAVIALRSCGPERVPDSFHASLEGRLRTLEWQPARRIAGLVVAAAAVTLVCFGWPWLPRAATDSRIAAFAVASDLEPDLGPEPSPQVERTLLEPAAPTTVAATPAAPTATPATAAPAVRPIELTIDTRPLADLLAVVWTSLRTPAPPATPPVVAEPQPDEAQPEIGARPLPVTTVARSEESVAPVVVVRSSGYVQIMTSGAPYEVIPALLALVAEPDPELRSAAEEHLRLMHDSFMENPELAAQLTPPPEPPRSRSLAALHQGETSANASLQRWEQWWSNNRQLVDR